MTSPNSVLIVGAGIFGVTAAQALNARGLNVTLIDPGPIPHPLASSTDITKMIRMDYGTDDFYFDMMTAAFEGWDRWNAAWGENLYHEDGFLLMKRDAMTEGTFEMECFDRLTARGHNPQRIDSAALATDHPKWNPDAYADGYLNLRAGWAESGNVVARIAAALAPAGVNVREGVTFARVIEENGRVVGVETTADEIFNADVVVMATGAWTPKLFPELSEVMWSVGLPVMHFLPDDLDNYRPPHFRPWSADISETGYYGFPVDATGVVKIANHGAGVPIDPVSDPRELPTGTEDKFREFIAHTFPSLADAPLVKTRLCLYCDTFDGDFWIDHDPNRPGLVIAAGGNGHGFKFAPVLGDLIADVVQRKPNPYAHRFVWRKRTGEIRTEDARAHG
ncbi:MAG: FAD-dependent oxidoreductase [Chloroflexota bacterium]